MILLTDLTRNSLSDSLKYLIHWKIVGLLFALVYCIDADCLHPATAPNYSNEKYAGLWYEIGKVRIESILHVQTAR